MAIPNTDYTTAIVIPSLPFNLTTTANDAGVTYDLWYKYTATANEVLSVFGFGSLIGYEPVFRVFEEVGGFPDDLPDDMYNPGGQNVPVTFPVETGKTYFFKFDHTSTAFVTPADLVISIIRHTPQIYPDGSLMIPDDTWGWPGAILSPATGEVLKFVLDFPAGERGDALTDGTILTEDYSDDSLKLYDKNLNLLLNIPTSSLGLTYGIIGVTEIYSMHGASPKFYIGVPGGGGVNASFKTMSPVGVVSPTKFDLPTAGLTSLAVNQAETIVYITGQSTSGGTIITKWDLVNNVALPNWNVTTGPFHLVLILKNDNIVVTSYNNTTHVITIEEYNNSQVLLHTYTFTNMKSVRIKPASDNPDSIWCWFEQWNPGGFSVFIKLRMSDGVHLQEFTRAQFEGGTYQPVETATPTDRFGHSFSCPFFLLYEGTVIPELSGIYFINTDQSVSAGGGASPWEDGGTGNIGAIGVGRHDKYYNRLGSGSDPATVHVKIPDPSIKTGLIGE